VTNTLVLGALSNPTASVAPNTANSPATAHVTFTSGATLPTGAQIQIGRVPFLVTGVLAPKGKNANGNDQDDFVLGPFATVARRLVGDMRPRSIVLTAVTPDQVDEAWEQIDALLRQRHRIPATGDADYTIHSQVELAAASVQEMKTFSTLLLSIAGTIVSQNARSVALWPSLSSVIMGCLPRAAC